MDPMTRAKNRVKAKSASASVEVRNKQRARLLLEVRKKWRRFVLQVQDKLYSETVDTAALADAGKYLTPEDYSEIVDERAFGAKLCGYPVCSNTPQKFTGKYRISRTDLKIYDLSELSCYCSSKCLAASRYFSNQLSTDPVYLRDLSRYTPIEVFPAEFSVSDVEAAKSADEQRSRDAQVMGYVKALLKTLPPTDFELKPVKERALVESVVLKNERSGDEPVVDGSTDSHSLAKHQPVTETPVPPAERFDEIEGYRVQIRRKGKKGRTTVHSVATMEDHPVDKNSSTIEVPEAANGIDEELWSVAFQARESLQKEEIPEQPESPAPTMNLDVKENYTPETTPSNPSKAEPTFPSSLIVKASENPPKSNSRKSKKAKEQRKVRFVDEVAGSSTELATDAGGSATVKAEGESIKNKLPGETNTEKRALISQDAVVERWEDPITTGYPKGEADTDQVVKFGPSVTQKGFNLDTRIDRAQDASMTGANDEKKPNLVLPSSKGAVGTHERAVSADDKPTQAVVVEHWGASTSNPSTSARTPKPTPSASHAPPRKRTSIISAQVVEPTEAMAVRAVGRKSSGGQLNKGTIVSPHKPHVKPSMKLISFEEVIRLEQAARKAPSRPSDQHPPATIPNDGGSLTDVDESQTEDETEENWLKPRKMKVKAELNLFGRCWMRLDRMVTETTKAYLRDPEMSWSDLPLETDDTELMRKSIFSQKIVQTVNNLRREYGIVTPLNDDIIGLVRTLSLSENTAVRPSVEDWTVAVVFVHALCKRLPALAKETDSAELWISMLERADGITVDHLSAFCGLFA
ncbi:hypothetical protein BJ742DRAFT_834650 [Cladochytrium replicatum]|nr:hypothetical protein BJ742DRAFT_834650 [Cladochytrium replicatum]